MKYKKTEIVNDKEIDKAIRKVGLRPTHRDTNISLAYIFDLLKGTRIASETIYKKLKKSVNKVSNS